MPSIIATTFRRTLEAGLPAEQAERLASARGGGPAFRETHRALMLGDRAAREWAASAFASEQTGVPSELDDLPQLGRPEDAYHALHPVAQHLRQTGPTPELRALAAALVELAEALQEIDTESDNVTNEDAFQRSGAAAATTLLRAAPYLGDEEFIISQADEALDDLVDLKGWKNLLGERFE